MTLTVSPQPMRPRRWFALIWATPVLFAALSAGIHLFNGGAFDAGWMGRTALLMSVPLLMADRMAMLSSARVRQITGRQFRHFAATTYATFWGVMMILLALDSADDQIAVQATVWVLIAPLFGAFMSRMSSTTTLRTPDLADRHLDLDKLAEGNWLQRTSHRWWAPVAAALWLALIWADRAADDLTYTLFWLVVLLAALPALPVRPPWRRNPFLLFRLAGVVLAVGAVWLESWIA